MNYVYNEPKKIDKSEFLEAIVSGRETLMCDAIVRAVHFIDDYDWLLREFTSLLEYPNMEVRGVTVTCIGHLARLNENAKKDDLLVILEPLLSDSDLAGRVEDAIDDVNAFL